MSKEEEIQKEVEDIDELSGTDVQINPETYIHSALIKAQSALQKDDVQGGILQFRILVEHIEQLCCAANMVPEDYTEKLQEYKESDEYKNAKHGHAKLANKKIELLMSEVFGNKTITTSLSLKKKNSQS